jgi:hypothetical protein
MDSQSNSKFYAGECACKKSTSSTKLAIQCEYCIGYSDNQHNQYNHNKGHKCSCIEVEITNYICNTCAEIRDRIDTLGEELDQLVQSLVTDIKQFVDCREKLNYIEYISIELRQLNRKLLENLIPNE